MPIKAQVNGKTFTFPDGTPQDVMGQAIDQYFATQSQPQQATQQQPLTQDQIDRLSPAQLEALDRANQYDRENQIAMEQANKLPAGQAVLAGVGAGLSRVARGTANLLLPEEMEVQNPNARQEQQLQEANPYTFAGGKFVGEVAGTLPAGGIAGSITRNIGMNVLGRLGLQAGTRGATTTGLALAGAGEGATAAAQLEENALTGAAFGAAAGAAFPYVLKAGKSVFQRLTGKSATDDVFDAATGELTAAAQSELRAAGVDPDQFGTEVQKILKDNYTQEIDLAAQARLAQLKEFAPDAQPRPSRLARSQAAQNAEEALIARGTPEGENLVRAEQQMQQQLQQGASRQLLGDLDTTMLVNFQSVTDDANRGLMGERVKQALGEISEIQNGRVKDLYSSARELVGEGVSLPSDNLKNAFNFAQDEYLVSENAVKKVGNLLKEYNVFNPADEGFETFKVSSVRQAQDLTMDNAEKLRQRLNQLDPRDGSPDSAFINIIRSNLDNQVDQMIDLMPEDAAVSKAFKAARSASAEYKRTFNEKELIGKLMGLKRGQQVDAIPAEKVMDTLLSSDLRSVQRLKALMLESPTETSRQAWDELRFTTIDEMLRSSMDRQTGAISGKRFTNRMATIGDERLKLLLGNEKFNQLKRFEQVIKDQVIPLGRLENVSGTAGVNAVFFDTLADTVRGAANASSGGVIGGIEKSIASRVAMSKALKEAKGAIGQTARAKRIKARNAVVQYFNSLIPTTTAVATAGEEE